MDYSKLFRTAAKGGYYKQEVNSYLRQMEKDTQEAQAGLQDQINTLAESRDLLSSEVTSFSERVGQLEEQLLSEKDRVRAVTTRKEDLYHILEEKQQELDDAILARHNDVAACEKEITAYLQEKKKLQEQVKQLEEKGKRFDNLHRNLKEYCLKAESDAHCLLETAKEQSMDAINVVDDVARELEIFQTDVGKLRGDLKIGTETLEDRLTALYYSLESCVSSLHGIKTRFYHENQLHLDGGYEYVTIDTPEADKPVTAEEPIGEAAEEVDYSDQDVLPFPQSDAGCGREHNGMFMPYGVSVTAEEEAAEEA